MRLSVMFTCAHAVLPTKCPSQRQSVLEQTAAQVSTVTLPLVHAKVTPEHLAYFGALGVLAAVELIEWPMVAVLVVGNAIARAHRQVVMEIAAGVDEAV